MKVIKTEEFEENGYTYEKVTYDNGTINTYIKPSSEELPPEPPVAPITNEDIMNKLNDMSSEQVSKSALDEAYREGVNSYGE